MVEHPCTQRPPRRGWPLNAAVGRRVHSGELFDMTRTHCDICGKPATIHETVREAGGVTSRHLCQEHGELRVIEEYYHRLPEAEREQIARVYRTGSRPEAEEAHDR